MSINKGYFLKECQESTLLEFDYKFGMARFVIRLYGNDKTVQIKCKTHHIYSDFVSDKGCDIAVFSPCLQNLGEWLAVEKGVYIPSKNFVQFMQEKRNNLNLAYGLRCSQYQAIIRFCGAFTIAFIPVGELLFE